MQKPRGAGVNVGASSGSSGITIGTTTISGGANTQVLFNLAGVVSSSANLTFSDTLANSSPALQVGTGSAGATGWIIGRVSNGVSGLWSTTVASQSAALSALQAFSSGTNLNAPTAGTLRLRIGDVSRMEFDPTAGRGPDITPGTAATDVAALSVTRTNNNAAVATGVKFTFTDTTSAAGFLPFQVLGGAAGATNLLSVSKAGLLDVPAYSAAGTPGIDYSGTTPANMTFVKGILTAQS